MQRIHPCDATIDFRFAPDSVWTLICLPDDAHKSLVREDGALLYDFVAAAFDEWRFERVVEFGAQTTHRPVSVEQWTESARRPIVHTVLRYPTQTLELTAFATTDDAARHDVVCWSITAHEDVSELYTGLTIDTSARNMTLAAFSAEGPHREVRAVSSDPWPMVPDWTDDLPFAEASEDAWALRSLGHDLVGRSARGFRAASGLMTKPTRLGPSEVVSGVIVSAVRGAIPDGFDEAAAEQALEDARRYWDELPLGTGLPTVPDPGVQDMLIACARNLMQARELEDGLPVLQVGPTIYRGHWLVDGHFMLETARYLGWDDIADAGLEVLSRRIKEDGSITHMLHEPHLKETAVGISTMVRQAELTQDFHRLEEQWPAVMKAVEFMIELRRQSDALPHEHPFHGLVPPGFGDGGIGGLRAEYTTVAWMLIGFRYALIGAETLGRRAEAETVADEFQRLLDAFHLRASEHRSIDEKGLAYLPMVAPGGGTHQFTAERTAAEVPRWRSIQPETATWALCQAIWPGEVFAAEDPVVQDLLALMDARDDDEGIPATTGWLPWQAVWTYAASFAAHAWLYADRPDKAVDYLYAFANHASSTRVWREEQPLNGTGNLHICGDMPHNWASAEFIRLAQHLLLFERGDHLELFAAVPEHWWCAGAEICLPSAPTRLGRFSITARVAGDGSRADIEISRMSGSGTADIRLCLPEGAAATVDGVGVAAGAAIAEMKLTTNQTVRVEVRLRRALDGPMTGRPER